MSLQGRKYQTTRQARLGYHGAHMQPLHVTLAHLSAHTIARCQTSYCLDCSVQQYHMLASLPVPACQKNVNNLSLRHAWGRAKSSQANSVHSFAPQA
jgi:hypothetical protein